MKILLVALIFFSGKTLAQDSVMQFVDVVTLDGVSKEQLFIRARQWLNEAFVSAKSVTQIADKESGELAGKGTMQVRGSWRRVGVLEKRSSTCRFNINIWVKDGKYKYEIKNIEAQLLDTTDPPYETLTSSPECPVKIAFYNHTQRTDYWQTLKNNAINQFNDLITSLNKAMKAPPKNEF